MLNLLVCASLFVAFAFAQSTAENCSPSRFEQPAYPSEAIRQRVSGVVEARILIGPDGTIKSAAYIGYPVLATAVQQAIDHTRLDRACGGVESKLIYRFLYEPIYKLDTGKRPPIPPRQSVTFEAPNEFLIKYTREPVEFGSTSHPH